VARFLLADTERVRKGQVIATRRLTDHLLFFEEDTVDGDSSGESDPREALEAAVAGDDAKANLTLAWRLEKPDHKVELVELQQSVASTFSGYAQCVGAARRAGAARP
jgi:hypothetical protein